MVLLVMVSGSAANDGMAAMLQFEEGLEADQTLSTDQSVISDALKTRATTYPAKKMRKTESGNWSFLPMEEGASDSDALFQVIVIAPELANASSLAVLFDAETFVESVW